MPKIVVRSAFRSFTIALAAWQSLAAEPRNISGIYPSLATFNNENECGTGAVVPWADRLWVISYGPHLPFGSSDKLYEITPDLKQIIRPESVGGTPANRMIHRESQQLIIGPYVIDAQRIVRVIPSQLMPGRLTGNACHLTDPEHKVYFATMEEGLYEVDVRSLEVTGLIRGGNKAKPGFSKEPLPATVVSTLPGYHGKGLYSGQGRLIYANNGEDKDKRALVDPTTPSGALAEWRHPGEEWSLIRRNQFTDVTGPGGILGSEHPETDPIWSMGWDHRSLILMALDHGKWLAYRLPKASHCYDLDGDLNLNRVDDPKGLAWTKEHAAIPQNVISEDAASLVYTDGKNQRWRLPRSTGAADGRVCREVCTERNLLNAGGTFYELPAQNAGGFIKVRPIATHDLGIHDYASYRGLMLISGIDAKAPAGDHIIRSDDGMVALWAGVVDDLWKLGKPRGSGGPWKDSAVKANTPSDPFLMTGFDRKRLTLSHKGNGLARIRIEADFTGTGTWAVVESLRVKPNESTEHRFSDAFSAYWVRLVPDQDTIATASFTYE